MSARIRKWALPVAAAALWKVASSFGTEGAPRLACDQPVYDFGTLTNALQVEHDFILRNDGTAELVIGKVRTTCGCTVGRPDRQTASPGERVTLHAEFSMEGRKGEQRMSFYVHSNDRQSPVYELRCVGTVLREIELEPALALWRAAPAGMAEEKTVSVFSRIGPDFRILGLETNGDFFTASLRVVRPGRAYDLVFRVEPQNLTGDLKGNVMVLTDHPAFPRIEVAIIVRAGKQIVASPHEIVLKKIMRPGETQTRFTTVRSVDNKPFSIRRVALPDPAITVSTEPLPIGGFRLVLKNMVGAADLNGQSILIDVVMEDKNELTVDVPIRVTD